MRPDRLWQIHVLGTWEFLRRVMAGTIVASALQLKAAVAAAKYLHAPMAQGGKKQQRQEAAERAGSTKFTRGAPPRLAAVDGKKVG